MNKEIEILYKIFELELAPPFDLRGNPAFPDLPEFCNRYFEEIGEYGKNSKHIFIPERVGLGVFNKVKQIYRLNKLSDDDVRLIIKHLLNWLQDNFDEDVNGIGIFNTDTTNYIIRPKMKY